MKSMSESAKANRVFSLGIRERQLQLGTKPNRFGTTKERKAKPRVPLTEKDKLRLEKEIKVLKERIGEPD